MGIDLIPSRGHLRNEEASGLRPALKDEPTGIDHLCRLTCVRCSIVGHEVKIETVPQRVAHTAFQLDETGVNGNSFHAQTAQISTVSVVWAWFKSPLAHSYGQNVTPSRSDF